METGVVYDFQGESPSLIFQAAFYFEDEAGESYEPFPVPDIGTASGTFAYPGSVGFHRMLMEDNERFYICDGLARRIAECELIEFGSSPG